MKAFATALAGAMLFLSAACAATVDGVTFPESIQVDGHQLVLNGSAARNLTVLQIRAYALGLYVEQPTHDAASITNGPGMKVLAFAYLHDGSKERVGKSFRDGLDRACGEAGCPATDGPDFDRLVQAFPAVKAGDRSEYNITPRGVRVTVNNRPIVTIDNPDMARWVLDAFIGAHPPAASVREALLGLDGGQTNGVAAR